LNLPELDLIIFIDGLKLKPDSVILKQVSYF